jgi:hypothetical protein
MIEEDYYWIDQRQADLEFAIMSRLFWVINRSLNG